MAHKGRDEHSMDFPWTPASTPTLSWPGNWTDTTSSKTTTEATNPYFSAYQPATVSPQDLELTTQSTDGGLAIWMQEESASSMVLEGAEVWQGLSDDMAGNLSTKKVQPSMPPVANPGGPTTTWVPNPKLAEHPEAPATITLAQELAAQNWTQVRTPATITLAQELAAQNWTQVMTPATITLTQELAAQNWTQVMTQPASQFHNEHLKEPETCEVSKRANDHLKVQHQPNDAARAAVPEQPFQHRCTTNRLAGCAQDYPIEIDDPLLDAPARPVRKRRMEGDAATKTTSAQQKLRRCRSKASYPWFPGLEEALAKPDTTKPVGDTIERINDWHRKDADARQRELEHVEQEIQRVHNRLRDLYDERLYLKDKEEKSKTRSKALEKISANRLR
ncbi:MAG: hypothetical protein LQ340_000197 [Diploschistes diacapsis]|nr:MAG: hypothetical protein LQ340_000197 [Diploschistes diacapsis]